MLTSKQFAKLYPHCEDPDGWVNAMISLFNKYEINTPKRQAAFISQCGHESGGWRVFSENLNYSAKALDIIFPKYFKKAGRNALDYARQPEKIANVVYSNRMGNAGEQSGDGWKYRGRGPIQLTGFTNYNNFSKAMHVDVTYDPSVVATNKEIAILSAIWFWHNNNLNMFADDEDIKGLTKAINGGYNGLEDRIQHYKDAIAILDDSPIFDFINSVTHKSNHSIVIEGVLRYGSNGDGVKVIQEALGLKADGIFGKDTEKRVKEWQRTNGLFVDGIVGPKTIEKLIG